MDNLKNQLEETFKQLSYNLQQIISDQEISKFKVEQLQLQYDELAQQLTDEIDEKQWSDEEEKSIHQKLGNLQQKKKDLLKQIDILENILDKDQEDQFTDSQMNSFKRKLQDFDMKDEQEENQVDGLTQNLNDLSLSKNKKTKVEQFEQVEQVEQVEHVSDQAITIKLKDRSQQKKQKKQKKNKVFQSELIEEEGNYTFIPIEKKFLQQTREDRIKILDQLAQQLEYYQYKEQYLNEQLEFYLYNQDIVLIDEDSQSEIYIQMNLILDQIKETCQKQQSESMQINKILKEMDFIQQTANKLREL